MLGITQTPSCIIYSTLYPTLFYMLGANDQTGAVGTYNNWSKLPFLLCPYLLVVPMYILLMQRLWEIYDVYDIHAISPGWLAPLPLLHGKGGNSG